MKIFWVLNTKYVQVLSWRIIVYWILFIHEKFANTECYSFMKHFWIPITKYWIPNIEYWKVFVHENFLNTKCWKVFIHKYFWIPNTNNGRVQRRKKNLWNFPLNVWPPPPSGKKIKKTKNDLLAMKQILYDMGQLTVPRWLNLPIWPYF